jgi:cell shape-determining protein MreC
MFKNETKTVKQKRNSKIEKENQKLSNEIGMKNSESESKFIP